jgi:putative transcriptional regulator
MMTMIRARRRDDGVTVQILDDGSEVPLHDETDWARVEAMTDEDIARAVADDPDAAPMLTDEQLAKMKVVWPTDIAATRRWLGLSQTEFAAWFGISPGTLRNWEQGRRVPEGPARVLLRVIERDPEAVRRAVG